MSTPIYPAQTKNGSLVLTSDYSQIVGDAIESVLRTEQGERVWWHDYGRDLEPFDSYQPRLLSTVRSAIASGIKEYPNVSFNLAASLGDDGQVEIAVEYQIPEGIFTRIISINLP